MLTEDELNRLKQLLYSANDYNITSEEILELNQLLQKSDVHSPDIDYALKRRGLNSIQQINPAEQRGKDMLKVIVAAGSGLLIGYALGKMLPGNK